MSRDELIERHAYLVPLTRQRVVPGVPRRIDPDDLEGEGYLALCRAAARFDPDRGAFRTFAIAHIRYAMLQYLRRADWVPRSLRARQRRGEAVDVLEVFSLQDVVAAEADDDELERAEQIADPAPGPEAVALERVAGEQLWRQAERLPGSLERVVRQRYQHGLTHRQIGRELRVSESRAYQLHTQALEGLREGMIMVEKGTPPGWTATEDAVLLAGWNQQTKRKLAERLGRSESALYSRYRQLREAPATNGHTAPGPAEEKESVALPQPALPPGLDPELAAMATVLGALEPLSQLVQKRVVRWVMERLGEE